ncbi:MAG TPA: hypothetical protein VFI91_10330 [Longimicrobiaceae bacterium]|nr:hypothetical protein [Longimicrobiaceae bacterium]
MNLVVAGIIGLIAGAHTSTWGMYKDAIHEGFTWPKYFRSIVVGAIVALVWQAATGMELDGAGDMVVFFGIVYATERLLLELWKGYIREEDQSKYFIPMQFGVLGKPIKSRPIRWAVLVGVVAVILLCGWGVYALQRSRPDLPAWLVLLTIGTIGGWLTAFGGAWKDAPVEGFETFKFFRSPGITFAWAVLLAFFTDNWFYLGIGAAGYAVATIETYKTFFFPNKPRGKFAGKPILFPDLLRRRYYFVPLYVAIWMAIIAAIVIGFTSPRQGLIG